MTHDATTTSAKWTRGTLRQGEQANEGTEQQASNPADISSQRTTKHQSAAIGESSYGNRNARLELFFNGESRK